MTTVWVKDNLHKIYMDDVKKLVNPKWGVSIRFSPCMYGNRVALNMKKCTVTIDDSVVGKSCNGDFFDNNTRKVTEKLKELGFRME